MRAVIIIHSLDQAMAAASVAASLGRPLTLLSAAGAGGSIGVGWFAALTELVSESYPNLAVTVFIDCDEVAGTAAGALRRGLNVVFTGHQRAFESLNAIAAPLGLSVVREIEPDLDLLGVSDPLAACRVLFGRTAPDVASNPTLG